MSLTVPFTVHVVFTGLILFVRKNGAVTHALLRDARGSHHGPGDHTIDPHDPYLAWPQGCKRLDRVRLTIEWLDSQDSPIPVSGGASPVGPPEVDKFPIFSGDDCDHQSFEWVPYFKRIGPSNPVDPECMDASKVKAEVVAQLLLEGGSIRSGRFGWGEEAASGSTVKNWIPALLYKRLDGDPGPTDRAAAELVIWDVVAPAQAKKVRVSCKDLDARPSGESCTGLPPVMAVRPGGDLWLTVSNSPEPTPHTTPHPGRRPNVQSSHFDMLYDLLSQSHTIDTKLRRMPKLPGTFRPDGILRNVIADVATAVPFYECGRHPEGGKHFEGGKDPLGYIHRPICIPGSADG